jgi:trans-aconitate 2-methyltransferase
LKKALLAMLARLSRDDEPDFDRSLAKPMAKKDFAAIESDYAFFFGHSTEAESDVAGYARTLASFAEGRDAIRMLDFGCGGGEFSERFLSALRFRPEVLYLTLVEPVHNQRDAAARRLAPFSQQPIASVAMLPTSAGPRFDLILANHSLYYVDNLDRIMSSLMDSLAPRGSAVLAMAGWDNRLMELWQIGFAMLGEPVPYYAADDVTEWLATQRIASHRTKSPYRLRFPDSMENRLRILRFLFADYLNDTITPRLLAEFNRHVQDGYVDVSTHSDQFRIDAG